LGNLRADATAPTIVNSSVRTREYLTGTEIERLMSAAVRKVAVQFGVATGTVQRIAEGLAASVAA